MERRIMTAKALKELAAQVHKLKPVVIIGSKGLTDGVQAQINQALDDHELIKIKIAEGDYADRSKVIENICSAQQAEVVTRIGRMVAIYRKRIQR